MVTVKILKRKDGSSVVVAVLVALILLPLINSVTEPTASRISNGQVSHTVDWKLQYLQPVVWVILQLLVLEILGWIYVLAADTMKKK